MSIDISVSEPILNFTSGLTLAEFSQQLELDNRLFLQRRLQAVRLRAEDQLFFAELPVWLYFLCLATEETPDVFMVLPVLQRIADCSPRLDLRILTQDADFGALSELLDDDIDLDNDLAEMDMPILFVLDEDWNQVAQWGPRPEAAEERLDAWLAQHPRYEELLNDEEIEESSELDALMEELTHLMRRWYHDDLTDQAVAEIRQIVAAVQADSDSGDDEK